MLEEFGKSAVEKDQEIRSVDDRLKEVQAGFSQTEKQRIINEISSVANELRKKIDQK